MNGDWDRLHGQHLRGMGEGAGWPASDEAEAREGTRKMEDHSSSSGQRVTLAKGTYLFDCISHIFSTLLVGFGLISGLV